MIQEQVEENESNNNQVDEQLPDYGEIEGEQIKLSGLDYKLLKEHKDKQEFEKKGFINSLKSKLNIIEGNVLDRVIKEQKEQSVIKSDPQLKKIMDVLQTQAKTKKIEKNVELYYEFDLNEFGSRYPRQIQKRLGKMSKKPIYLHFDDNFMEGFSYSLIKRKNKADESDMVDAREIMSEGDQDDIFGDSNSEKERVDNKIDIKIGKKLQFGLQENIFAEKREKPIEDEFPPIEPNEQNDKYFFMRKKVKKNQEMDGYGECYYQSGPSLQELVQMKKQGLQFYGDEREFKAKEKKAPNLAQDYKKIQKIIQKKNK